LGLAAVGVVSLASAVKAEETANTVLTAASSTTLSGYVDTSAHWNPGTGNANVPAYGFNSPSKADGFNLDAVKVSLEKPLDESEWAAGYKVDLMFGPDANLLGARSVGTPSDLAIRQAYVALRTPVGNGIDWKIGVFDTVVGYESIDAVNNPNYTRSWGFTLEPTTHTGILGTYRVADWLSLAGGVADTAGPVINARANPPRAESYKTYMGSVSLTAPESWGFLAGSTLYGGIVNGFGGNSGIAADQINLYSGVTLAMPVTGLRLGLAYDYLGVPQQAASPANRVCADSLGAYASFQATEKLSLHARGEYVWQDRADGPLQASTLVELTGTVQYDLWKNVVSRVEVRWDRAVDGSKPFGGTATTPPSERNAVLIAGNLIYKF
jgi:hypothetical protein